MAPAASAGAAAPAPAPCPPRTGSSARVSSLSRISRRCAPETCRRRSAHRFEGIAHVVPGRFGHGDDFAPGSTPTRWHRAFWCRTGHQRQYGLVSSLRLTRTGRRSRGRVCAPARPASCPGHAAGNAPAGCRNRRRAMAWSRQVMGHRPDGWQSWVMREQQRHVLRRGRSGQRPCHTPWSGSARRCPTPPGRTGAQAVRWLSRCSSSASSGVPGSACTSALKAAKPASGCAPENTRNCSRGSGASSRASAGSSKYSTPLFTPTPTLPTQATPPAAAAPARLAPPHSGR